MDFQVTAYGALHDSYLSHEETIQLVWTCLDKGIMIHGAIYELSSLKDEYGLLMTEYTCTRDYFLLVLRCLMRSCAA